MIKCKCGTEIKVCIESPSIGYTLLCPDPKCNAELTHYPHGWTYTVQAEIIEDDVIEPHVIHTTHCTVGEMGLHKKLNEIIAYLNDRDRK